ncbi:MAG: glutamate-5-semialdehyde dehydrogenase [Candidatus Sericytochromatia bacterium]
MEIINSNLEKTVKASRKLLLLEVTIINKILIELSDSIIKNKNFILEENQKDLDKMDTKDPKYDRLKLTAQRIESISNDLKNVAKLDYPVGKVLEKKILGNGLELSKITVPLGVIGIIYEARPNVTIDVFSLCLKSGNACVLKGGKEAENSNFAFIKLIYEVLDKNNIDKNIVYLLPNDREVLQKVLTADKYIDVIIPRGSSELINYVRKNSTIPVIETGAGIVHTFFDESGDIEIGKKVIFNAKTRRVSVCNALDTLIIHKNRLNDLYNLISDMEEKNVEIFADELSYQELKNKYKNELLLLAKEEDFGKEFLDYKMSIKTVNNLEEAIEHITKYTSKHSEAIISQNEKNIDLFLKSIDAAALYINTSTAFTDGSQFGLGAEIGISTQKLHARGPMALNELNSYKWIIKGNGQIREN